MPDGVWLSGFPSSLKSAVQISVMGKSLGGATAIHLAAANPGKIRSLVVENTFTSIEDVAYKVRP